MILTHNFLVASLLIVDKYNAATLGSGEESYVSEQLEGQRYRRSCNAGYGARPIAKR
jgi:hypothetical protein